MQAGRVSSFREASQSAKTGEAHGHRQLPSVYGQPSVSVSTPVFHSHQGLMQSQIQFKRSVFFFFLGGGGGGWGLTAL